MRPLYEKTLAAGIATRPPTLPVDTPTPSSGLRFSTLTVQCGSLPPYGAARGLLRCAWAFCRRSAGARRQLRAVLSVRCGGLNSAGLLPDCARPPDQPARPVQRPCHLLAAGAWTATPLSQRCLLRCGGRWVSAQAGVLSTPTGDAAAPLLSRLRRRSPGPLEPSLPPSCSWLRSSANAAPEEGQHPSSWPSQPF